MKYFFFFLLPIWSLFLSIPEPKLEINGIVKDKATNLPIESCTIKVKYLKNGITFETTTDKKGQFNIAFFPGKFTLAFEAKTFVIKNDSYSLFPAKDTLINTIVFLEKQVLKTIPDSIILKSSTFEIHKIDDEHDKIISGVFNLASPSISPTSPTARGIETGDRKIFEKSRKDFRGSSGSASPLSKSAEDFDLGDERVSYKSDGKTSGIKAGTLTAGEINDFNKWFLWNDLTKGELRSYSKNWNILPKHRFSVLVTNESKNPLTDIEVVLKNSSGTILWKSHTDNTGKAELWANLFDSSDLKKGNYKIEAVFDGKSYALNNAKAFGQSINIITIPAVCSQPLNLDIVFAVDATGSMGDEITYLQAELQDVIEKVKGRNPKLNLSIGSVFYRDKEDAYLTVEQDLTSDVGKLMNFMKAQNADGGGDEPEGVDAAMEVAISKFNWSSKARARVMFLVLDASPHSDPESLAKLKKYTTMAAEKGIRIVPIVCSGIDKAGEYLMRSIALATNGNYIFLTDHSGIGNMHIAPSTDKYVVETLNLLLVRLLQQYVFMPECNQTVNSQIIDSLQKTKSDSISNDSTLVNNPKSDSFNIVSEPEWLLKYYPNPCRGILQVDIYSDINELYISDLNGKLILKIDVPKEQGHVEIDLSYYPAGIYFLQYTVKGKTKAGKFILTH